MKQILLTPAMGKRLIGKGMVVHPSIQRVLQHGTLVIIAGSTNGYVAEEVLRTLGQAEGFSRVGFRRGITTAPTANPPKLDFPGDVVIRDGVWQKGLTVQEVAEELVTGDVVLKGANALDRHGQAAVQIGHPKGGSILSVMPAIIGRRVELIVPVGLEKRVFEDIHALVLKVLAIDTEGPRLMPLPGKTFSEIDAIRLLTGTEATLIAAGGIYGAEGASWLGISGAPGQVEAAMELVKAFSSEPACEI
jgi:hypothetical protein